MNASPRNLKRKHSGRIGILPYKPDETPGTLWGLSGPGSQFHDLGGKAFPVSSAKHLQLDALLEKVAGMPFREIIQGAKNLITKVIMKVQRLEVKCVQVSLPPGPGSSLR